MFRFAMILVVFMISLNIAPAHSNTPILVDYISLPLPDCGFNWYCSSSFFDPLLANPRLSLVELKAKLTAIRNDKTIEACRIKLDLASVYSRLDSTETADRYRAEALKVLKNNFQSNQTAECAFLIGQAQKNEDESRLWYEIATVNNNSYYPAYFELVSTASGPEDNRGLEWVQRTETLAKRLLKSKLDAEHKAEVAYQYAWMKSELMLRNWISNAHSSEIDTLAFINAFCNAFCSQELVELYETAKRLDPSKAQYQLAYSAAKLGQIFFSTIEPLLNEGEESDLASASLSRTLNPQHNLIFSVRNTLAVISPADKNRFPAVDLYLAIADCMLGDHQRAYQEITSYLHSQTNLRDNYPMSLHCYILGAIAEPDGDNSRLADELLVATQRKCNAYPTSDDYYRLGYYIYNRPSDLDAACAAFRKAVLLDFKDLRPRFGLAACALEHTNLDQARAIIQDLQREKLDNDDLARLYLLQAILVLQEGNRFTAIQWIQKALDLEPDLPQAKRLLEKLKQ